MILPYFRLANIHEISGYSSPWTDTSEGHIRQEFTNQDFHSDFFLNQISIKTLLPEIFALSSSLEYWNFY